MITNKNIESRLKRLEGSQMVKEGDYIIVTRKDGSEEQLYWVDAFIAVLSGEVTAVRPGKLQNGENFGLCEACMGGDDETA